jgi:hypothetical protein
MRRLRGGGLNQKECPVTVQFPSCDSNFNAYAGRCIQRKADIQAAAKQAMQGFADTLAPAAFSIAQATEATTLILSRDRNSAVLQRFKVNEFASRPDVKAMLMLAHKNGYATVTFGIAMGASKILGANTEAGYAFSTEVKATKFAQSIFQSEFPPTEYITGGFSGGLQFGVSGEIVIGFYRAGNQPKNGFGGDSHGATVSIAAIQGSGAAAWFNYGGTLAGITYSGTVGVEFSAGAYNRVTTSVNYMK